jgi:hypothetical protein
VTEKEDMIVASREMTGIPGHKTQPSGKDGMLRGIGAFRTLFILDILVAQRAIPYRKPPLAAQGGYLFTSLHL